MVAAPTSLPARVLQRGRLTARIDAAAIPLLAGLVGLSFVLRLTAGWLRATPSYFADEYLYAELGRSIGEGGRPAIRGLDASFPALLQPLVTAPAWLFDDALVSYRLTQALGAVAMSLAAVPVFLLACRLGLGRPISLGVAAFALAGPDLLFASWVMAEPFAYPLFLAAVLSGTAALSAPGRRTGLLFVAFALLATSARMQFAVLPLCFLAALLVVGLREGRLRAAVREQVTVLCALGTVVAVVALAGHDRVLGLYAGTLDEGAAPLVLLERLGLNGLVLAYSSGWILVPAALLGLALGIAQPRSRAELAFTSLAVTATSALLLEAGLAGAVEHAQERYAFYVIPLLAVAFGLYASRGWPSRTQLALLAAGLVAVAAQVPLAGFTAVEGKAHSPFLMSAFRLEEALGSPGTGSLAIAAVAGGFCVLLIAVSARPAWGTPAVLGLAVTASAAASLGAIAFDSRNSVSVRQAYLPAEPSWVDGADLGSVTLVRGPEGVRTEALEQLFWNRTVDRVVLLPGAEGVDHYPSPALTVGRDGGLRVGERALRGPLLVDGYGGTIHVADAERVASSQSHTLWRPRGEARLSLYLAGRYSDGWLAGVGRMYLWPERPGGRVAKRVSLTLTAPPASEGLTIRFQDGSGKRRDVRLEPGRPQVVSFEACSQGPWHMTYAASARGFVGTRIVSAQATEPAVTAMACGPSRAAAAPTESV